MRKKQQTPCHSEWKSGILGQLPYVYAVLCGLHEKVRLTDNSLIRYNDSSMCFCGYSVDILATVAENNNSITNYGAFNIPHSKKATIEEKKRSKVTNIRIKHLMPGLCGGNCRVTQSLIHSFELPAKLAY